MTTRTVPATRESRSKGGKTRAKAFTGEYQSQAGKKAYESKVRYFLEVHWPNLDRAAQALTGFRRVCGLKHRRGITAEYMKRYAIKFGMLFDD